MNRLRRRRLLDPILAWLAADRPFLGVCLGLQLLFDGSDEDGARTFGVIPGRTSLLADAPRLPHIGWNQVELRRDHPLFDGHPVGFELLLRPLVRRAAGGPGCAARSTLGRDGARRPLRQRRRPGPDRRRPVPSRTQRPRRPAAARELRRSVDAVGDRSPRSLAGAGVALMLCHRVIPCLDVANGRVVKGTQLRRSRRRGRSAGARRALRAGGRRRARLPRHHRGAGRPRHAPRHRRADRPPRVHPADGRRRRPPRERDARRAACRAPTRFR